MRISSTRHSFSNGWGGWYGWWLVLMVAVSLGACAPLHISPVGSERQSEAILVLPGVGLKRDALPGFSDFEKAAGEAGYDVYLADFRSRRSVDQGVRNLRQFVDEHELRDYQKVHVFAYILGGRTFNRYQMQTPLKNVGNVAYDRSPLQELAPKLATTGWMRGPTWIVMGPIIADLAATPYTPLSPQDSKVGLLIENRATPFIRERKARALALAGKPSFEPGSFGQVYDAVIQLPFNHDEMYERWDVIGPELLHFFEHGEFTSEAPHKPLGIDPFAENTNS